MQELAREQSSGGAAKFGKLLAVKCDVAKEDEVKAMFAAAKAQFGGIDVCVNNAGLAHDAPLLSGSTDDWRNMLEVSMIALQVYIHIFLCATFISLCIMEGTGHMTCINVYLNSELMLGLYF